MTRTIGVDADQYQELCEAAQARGRTVSEIVTEAVTDR